MKHQRKKRISRQKGFTLASILIFGALAVAMLGSMLPLVDNITRTESATQHINDLRTAAEVGVDYALSELNESSASGIASSIDNSTPASVPAAYLSTFQNISVRIRVTRIPKSEFDLYSLDPLYEPRTTLWNQEWRCIDSTARQGSLSRSVRVFVQPALSNSNLKPSSFFKNALYGESSLQIDSGEIAAISNSSAEVLVGKSNNEIKLADGASFDGKLDAPPGKTITVPPTFTNIERNPATSEVLQSQSIKNALPIDSLNSSTTNGVFTTANFDTAGNAVTTIEPTSPVKVIVQDTFINGQEPAPPALANGQQVAINIDSSKLVNKGSASDFQFWYDGTRDVQISLNGNQPFRALVYAPKAKISLSGPGNFEGALVGATISMNSTGSVRITTDVQNSSTASGAGLAYSAEATSKPTFKAISYAELKEALVP